MERKRNVMKTRKSTLIELTIGDLSRSVTSRQEAAHYTQTYGYMLSRTCHWMGFAVMAGLLVCAQARAAVIITLEQVGTNVVATGTGSVNLGALSLVSTTQNSPPFMTPNGGRLLIGNSSAGYDLYSGTVSGASSFGSGGEADASTGTGTGDPLSTPAFGPPDFFIVPSNYSSGASISGSATWDNTTLAALGVKPGTYKWTWGSGGDADSMTLNVVGSVATTPEPGSFPLVVAGIVGLAVGSYRRRSRAGEGS
jgi:hypothetical protein